jgi:hypothetical protein
MNSQGLAEKRALAGLWTSLHGGQLTCQAQLST